MTESMTSMRNTEDLAATTPRHGMETIVTRGPMVRARSTADTTNTVKALNMPIAAGRARPSTPRMTHTNVRELPKATADTWIIMASTTGTSRTQDTGNMTDTSRTAADTAVTTCTAATTVMPDTTWASWAVWPWPIAPTTATG